MSCSDLLKNPFELLNGMIRDKETDEGDLHYVAVMATVSSNSQPCQKIIEIMSHDSNHKVRFFSISSTRKITDIINNPRVSFIYTAADHDLIVNLHGNAWISGPDDSNVKKKCWSRVPKSLKVCYHYSSACSQFCDDLKNYDMEKSRVEKMFENVDASEIPFPSFLSMVTVDIDTYEFFVKDKEEPSGYKFHRFLYRKDAADANKWQGERLSP